MEKKQSFSLVDLRRQYRNPHELYNALRSHDRIYFDTTGKCWIVTGYDAIRHILSDRHFSSKLGAGVTPTMGLVSKQMLFMDGEEHQHIQNMILRPLAQMMKSMKQYVHDISQAILREKGAAGEMDLIGDFASTVSLLAIAKVLGLPLDDRDELAQLERWSDTFEDVTSGFFHGSKDMQNIKNLQSYFSKIIAEKKRSQPADLIDEFMAAKDFFKEEEDLIANCVMVFAAGRITTKKLIGNGVPLLLQQWEHIQRLNREEPQQFPKLLGEELLRVVTPTRYLIRQATETVDLSEQFPGRHVVQQGEKMLLYLEAGNYDVAAFPHPERLDPHRRPNRHIAFGYGKHQCPGATMARLEAQVVLEVLLSLSQLRPKRGTTPTWNPNPNLGGYNSFPVTFVF